MKKALLALLGAALALALVIAVSRWRDAAASRPRLVFGDTRYENAVELRIRYFGDSVRLIREGGRPNGRWVVEGDDFPADTTHLVRAFTALASVQEQETVTDSVDAAGRIEYGLSPDEAKHVAWRDADGATHRVVLGKLSGIDYGSIFWQHEGSPAVYRTPGKFVWDFSSRPVDWKDTNLFYPAARFTPEQVQTLDVDWKSVDTASGDTSIVSYRLERRGDSDFALVKPFAATASRAEASKLFRDATQFKIDFFVPGGDSLAAGAGLDAPFMTLRIGLKDGNVRTVTAGSEVEMLYRYARHASHPDPVRVFKWRFEYFRKQPEALVGR